MERQRQFISLDSVSLNPRLRTTITESATQPETNIDFQQLVQLGVFSPFPTGIQIDLNVAYHKAELEAASNLDPDDVLLTEADLCNHACRLKSEAYPKGGGYGCPAAYNLPENKGLDKNSFASREDIISGIHTTTQALQELLPLYIDRLREAGYSETVIEGISKQKPKPEVNLFGGNPEMHPDILTLIEELTQEGYPVTFTTTGKKLMESPDFVRKMLLHPPTRMAISSDDLPQDLGEIARLCKLEQPNLREEYRKIDPKAGQQQKALEAIHVLNLSRQYPNFPPITVNFVLHEGNLDHAKEIMQLLGERYPNASFNPYPTQGAFSGESINLSNNHLQIMESIIDDVIQRHFDQREEAVDFRVMPRLPYYLMLKSVFNTYRGNSKKINELLAGDHLWQCYKDPIFTGRYVQIGAANGSIKPRFTPDGKLGSNGGHTGCYWERRTVTDPTISVWYDSPDVVRRYITHGMQELAQKADDPCPGCGFPRLDFDEPSIRNGIADPQVKREYLAQLNQFVGV